MEVKKIRVLIVDDSFFMRKLIGDILCSDPSIEIVGEASDGIEALKQIAELQPQVVTLDIEMPRMGGLETLRKIIDVSPHPSVVVVSGYTQEGASITLQCLEMGAVDFVLKPSGSFSLDMDKVKTALIEKVKIAAEADSTKALTLKPSPLRARRYRVTDGIVVIGASTGGPAALETLLPAFPQNFPCPILVAQHLPKEFTNSFAARLDKRCPLQVVPAEHNMRLAAATIYIACGGSTSTVSQKDTQYRALKVQQDDTKSFETPSINRLMESAAMVYQDKTIGVILTGMGKDGADGMARIKQVGGSTIAQDRSTSVVFGMPGEVVERKLADAILPLDQIAEKVSELLG